MTGSLLTPTASLSTLPRLGVGLLYNPSLSNFLRTDLDVVEQVSVIPDTLWTDHGPQADTRYTDPERSVALLEWLRQRRPLTAHSVGLSIGSADLYDEAHVEQMATWQERYGFVWHSDHLSFVRVGGAEGHDLQVGLAVPVPYDEEVLDLITERVRRVQARVPVPFLLENNVAYINLPDQDMSEPEFLNRLTASTGCGLVLDLHNVFVNATNHGFDASEFVAALDLTRVVEVHIAGGEDLDGVYTDAHSGSTPEPVWTLLEQTVKAAPNLCAITFEFHESAYPRLRVEGLRRELDRARTLWMQRVGG